MKWRDFWNERKRDQNARKKMSIYGKKEMRKKILTKKMRKNFLNRETNEEGFFLGGNEEKMKKKIMKEEMEEKNERKNQRKK